MLLLNININININTNIEVNVLVNSRLDELEYEAIKIIRDIYFYYPNETTVLYSIGKDSSVLMHLMKKAFYPEVVKFPFLHIDTGWKFQEMINFRDEKFKDSDLKLIVEKNHEAIKNGVNPFDYGASYTDIMKTNTLKEALDSHNFKIAIGGARREEEKSRAKERFFSVRGENHSWNPKKQRPEVNNNLNYYLKTKDTARIFPMSNWTEVDIWEYILRENIEVVSLYFSEERKVIKRNGNLIMLDDDRIPLHDNEEIHLENIRFRTLGCYPLTGAMLSNAKNITDIINELKESKYSERSSRIIDYQVNSSMEKRKKEGYF